MPDSFRVPGRFHTNQTAANTHPTAWVHIHIPIQTCADEHTDAGNAARHYKNSFDYRGCNNQRP